MNASANILVNEREINAHDVHAEMQYHPAESVSAAQHQAARALVVRELLCQRAVALGIGSENECRNDPDQYIDQLLDQELKPQQPHAQEVRRYYERNRRRFVSSPVFNASHILYLAPPEDQLAREQALARAEADLLALQQQRHSFATLARSHSACPSAEQDGALGNLRKGQTVPAFEEALLNMRPDSLCQAPVASEVGYHLIYLHSRQPGSVLAFEQVEQWIGELLMEQRWRQGVSQYVQLLAGSARISGFSLNGASSPLVQ